MTGMPARNETAPYYYTYIDRIREENVLPILEKQLNDFPALLHSISEQKSLHRYAPGKWSIRQVLNHINDCERMFLFRAMWFARGFPAPLPSFDQDIAVQGAEADRFSWASHVAEFCAIREATLPFFRNLPEEAWMRTGIASGNPFTVRSLAFIIAGHADHHLALVRERYL
jgi:DinB superfamily